MEESIYIVTDENTLGYVRPDRPTQVGVLGASLIRGGRNWRDGPYELSMVSAWRMATSKDFDTFRVCADGHQINPHARLMVQDPAIAAKEVRA